MLFPDLFRRVVFGVALGREVAAETHGDRTSSYFGEAGEDDDVGGGDGSGETGGEGKRHGETAGEADDDVANGFGGFEVSFDVGIVGVRVGRVGRFLHGGSVVQPAYCWVSINRRPSHPDRKF